MQRDGEGVRRTVYGASARGDGMPARAVAAAAE